MRKWITIITCVVISLTTSFSFASQQPYKYKLDNGLTVVVNEMPNSPTAAIYMWVKTGSANEYPYLGSGITHFLEHMLFKGTDTRPVGKIPEEVKEIGGKINASTSYDYTVFTLTVPRENFTQGLDLISDMMMNAKIDPEEVEKEREVIINEMRMVNDRPARQLSRLVFETVFLRHPYKHPIIGYKEVFKSIDREDLVDYYNTWYVPNNMILSVAGAVDVDDIKPIIEDQLGKFPQQVAPIRNLPNDNEQITHRYAEKFYPTDLTRVAMAYLGVSILNKDVYALDVLAMALGQGASSRLFKSIREEQKLVSSVSASNLTPMDKGVFEVEGVLKEGVSVDQFVQAVEKEIEQIKSKGVKPDELDKVKKRVLADNIYGRQVASGVAFHTAIEEAFLQDPSFSEKYAQEISKITNDDIIRVARQYLTYQNQTIAVVKPKATDEESVKQSASQQNETEKIVLDNGIVILLRQDSTLPIFSINAAFEGGSRHEPEDQLGINGLMSGLWRRGVKGKTYEQMNQEIEALAGSVGTYVGNNSLGVNIGFLSEDIDVGLKYLYDVIRNPTFPEEDLTKLKALAKQGLKARKDNIGSMTMLTLRQTMFETHPFRLDTAGTEESIDKITRQDIVEHFHQYISPKNMVVSIFGDFDKDQLLKRLKKDWANWQGEEVALPTYIEELPEEQKQVSYTMDKEQAMVVIGFLAPDMFDPDQHAMDIIGSIMGSSLDGRLFKTIREELGKAYSTHASVSMAYDTGFIYFYALTAPENAQEVKDLIFKEIKKMEEGFSDKEIEDAKTTLKSHHAMSLEDIGSQSQTSALNELYGFGFNYYTTYNDRVNQVTKEQIDSVIKQYLTPERATVVITSPSEQ